MDSLIEEYLRTRDASLRDRLIAEHLGLVSRLARRHARFPEEVDDLLQVGYLGLMKAIDRFDPDRGVKFVTFATPTISGEMLRYLRDKGRIVHIPRHRQEAHTLVRKTVEEMSQDLGRKPTHLELAQRLGTSEDEIRRLLADREVLSLDGEVGSGEGSLRLAEIIGQEDQEIERVVVREVVEKAMQYLSSRERLILYMYFFEESSQAEIANYLGISQMHVSRLQRSALEQLRKRLEAG